MAGISVADIIGSIELNSQQLGETKSVVTNSMDKIKSIQETIAADNVSAAQDAAIVSSTKNAGILKKQEADAEAKRVLGTDMNSASNIVSQLAPKIRSGYQQLDELDKVIAQKKSVNILDNPVDWLVNQLTLNTDVEKYNGIAREVTRAETQIKTMQDLTQEAAQTSLATLETTSKVSAAAESRLVALTATTKANEALIAAQTADVDKVAQLSKINGALLQNEITKLSLVNDEADRNRRNQEYAEARADRQLRLKAYLEDKKDKQAVNDSEEQMLAVMNSGRKVLGQRPFSSKYDLATYMKSTEGKDNSQKIFDIGFQATESVAAQQAGKAGKQIVYDSDSAMTADLLVNTRGKLDPSMKKVQDLITGNYTGIINGTIPAGTLDRKDKKAVLGAVSSLNRDTATAMSRDITKNKDTNIYSAPDLGSLMIANPDLATNPVISKLLAPEIKAVPNREFDPQYILNRAVDGIANGEISYNEVVKGVQELAAKIVVTNNATRGYERVGLPIQKDVRVAIQTDPNALYFTGDKTVVLSDVTAVSTTVNKMLAAKVAASKYGKIRQEAGATSNELINESLAIRGGK